MELTINTKAKSNRKLKPAINPLVMTKHSVYRVNLSIQIRHLNRGDSRLRPLVPRFCPGTLNRLFNRIRGNHAVDDGDSRIQTNLCNPFRAFIGNVIEMRRRALG